MRKDAWEVNPLDIILCPADDLIEWMWKSNSAVLYPSRIAKTLDVALTRKDVRDRLEVTALGTSPLAHVFVRQLERAARRKGWYVKAEQCLAYGYTVRFYGVKEDL